MMLFWGLKKYISSTAESNILQYNYLKKGQNVTQHDHLLNALDKMYRPCPTLSSGGKFAQTQSNLADRGELCINSSAVFIIYMPQKPVSFAPYLIN